MPSTPKICRPRGPSAPGRTSLRGRSARSRCRPSIGPEDGGPGDLTGFDPSERLVALRQVVDLFGRSGHDAIAITDHIVNRDNGLGKIAHAMRRSLDPESWKRYEQARSDSKT